MKSILLQAGIIIGASVVIALVYNAVSPNSLDLVRKPLVLPPASDSLLFADDTPPAPVDTAVAAVPKDTVKPAVQPAGDEPDKAQQKAQAPDAAQAAEPDNTADTQEEQPTAKDVTYEQVARLVKDPNVLFIDARNADEYAQGHIRDARNYFTHDFEKHIPEIMQIDRDRRIVVYCGGGACELSHELAGNLVNFGFRRVFVYTGGWDEWKKKQGAN